MGGNLKSGKNHPSFGKKHTEEAKIKMRKNHTKRSGKNHPCYGNKHSKKTKRKMRENQSNIKGKNHPNSKINKKEGLEIYKKYKNTNKTQKQIAKKYNVDRSTISLITTCKHWTTKEIREG